MFINKGEGAIISTLPITFYVYLYYNYVLGNTHTSELMLIFSIGIFFIFFRKLEEPEELLFLDKGTGGYWGEGYCLVPSFAPFLRNIGINFPWGLRNGRLNEVHERTRNIDIHHYQDQRDLNYRVNVETSLMVANINRLFDNLIRWIFGFNKGKPELFYQRIGFRIIILALILGWGGNTFSQKETNSRPKVEETDIELLTKNLNLLEVSAGDCVKIPNGAIARIGIWTLPTRYTNNISDLIYVELDGKLQKWLWSNAFRDKPIFSKRQIVLAMTVGGDGQICF